MGQLVYSFATFFYDLFFAGCCTAAPAAPLLPGWSTAAEMAPASTPWLQPTGSTYHRHHSPSATISLRRERGPNRPNRESRKWEEDLREAKDWGRGSARIDRRHWSTDGRGLKHDLFDQKKKKKKVDLDFALRE